MHKHGRQQTICHHYVLTKYIICHGTSKAPVSRTVSSFCAKAWQYSLKNNDAIILVYITSVLLSEGCWFDPHAEVSLGKILNPKPDVLVCKSLLTIALNALNVNVNETECEQRSPVKASNTGSRQREFRLYYSSYCLYLDLILSHILRIFQMDFVEPH